MDIGISTACFYPEVLTEDTLKIVAGMGFTTIEVFLETASEYREDYCRRLREDIEKSITSGFIRCIPLRYSMSLFCLTSTAPGKRTHGIPF